MADIFNLFGGVEKSIKQSLSMSDSVANGPIGKPAMKSQVLRGTPVKLFGASNLKPKGLSVRSSSDLNIHVASPRPSTTKKDSSEPKLLKPKLTQVDVFGRPISPRSKSLQIHDSKSIPAKKLSPKFKSPKSIEGKISLEDGIFKKPLPLRTAKKKEFVFPESEKLLHYYDEELEFNNIYARALEDEYKNLTRIISNDMKMQQDEGFESDPEMPPSPIMPAIKVFSELSDDDFMMDCSLDLPEISDIDDNDDDF